MTTISDIPRQTQKLLQTLWYNPRTGLGSARELYYAAWGLLPPSARLTQAQVRTWVNAQEPAQVHRQRREPRQVASQIPTAPRQLVQVDLADLSSLSNFNRGKSFILIAVDAFSKRIWALPLRDKTDPTMLRAFKLLFDDMGELPKTLGSDNGNEFSSAAVKSFMEDHHIRQLFGRPGNPRTQAFAERTVAYLKGRIFKWMTASDRKDWVSVLPALVDAINDRPNRTTGIAPIDADRPSEDTATSIKERIREAAVKSNAPISREPTLEVGDHVRIALPKKALGKSYHQQWSSYTLEVESIIHSRRPYVPVRYKLEDGHTYYAEELQKVEDVQHRSKPGPVERPNQPAAPRAPPPAPERRITRAMARAAAQ